MNNIRPLEFEEVVSNITDWAERGHKLLIISHRSPDGDTLGSAFALKLIYEALGGVAQCTCKSEGAPYLRFLYAGQDFITYKEGLEEEFDRIITVDVAAPGQMGSLENLCSMVDMMIDHHAKGEVFAPHYVDGEASAVGEIIFEIYTDLRMEGKIEAIPEASARIYAAISSDTGSFKYSNVTPKTHMYSSSLISEMTSAGIDHSEYARILHDSYKYEDLKARMLAIQNLKVICDGKLSYVFITNEMLEKEGLCDDNTGFIVDIPRSVEGVLVGVSVKQSSEDPTEFRISARSNSEIDVSEICALFGGGGHKKAAGGRVQAETCKEAITKIVSAFENAVMNYTEEV